MIETIALEAANSVEPTTFAQTEGLHSSSFKELTDCGAEGPTGDLRVGGDVESVLSALNVNIDGLAAEIQATEVSAERVPLTDSKGDVRHEVSQAEAEHYSSIGLRAAEVNGHECLIRDDISWKQVDGNGLTNLERAEQGLAPQDAQGRPYELHHVEQKADGMLAELTKAEHVGPEINSVLHDSSKSSEIDRGAFDTVRSAHWQTRAAEVNS